MKINVIRFRYDSKKEPIEVAWGKTFNSFVCEAIDETTSKTVYSAYVQSPDRFISGKVGGCFTEYDEAKNCAIALLPIREAEYEEECKAYAEQARNFLKED